MPQHKWNRRDIGCGAKLTVVTETVLDRNRNEQVEIKISLEAYKRLVAWASVGRTIDGAMQNCTDNDVVEELWELKVALSECHAACRRRNSELDQTSVVDEAENKGASS